MEHNTQRGTIQMVSDSGNGLVHVNGQQHDFHVKGMWRSVMPPKPGMLVDVTFDAAGAPLYLTAVPDSQVAREQAEKAMAGALRVGTATAGGLKARVGIAVLVAEVLLLAAFFVMPCLYVGNDFARQNFTGWDAIGFSVRTMQPNDHGLLSLIAIFALFAPLAVSFLQKPWARWLYAAPLGFVVLACISILMQIAGLAHEAGEMSAGAGLGSSFGREAASGITSLIHLAPGAFVVIMCAVYLATRTFKRQP